MPLGGLLPYDDEMDYEDPVSPEFGDLTDLQAQGPDGDRDMLVGGAGDELMKRLLKKKAPRPAGLPQVAGQPEGVGRFMEDEPNMDAVAALLQGLRG